MLLRSAPAIGGSRIPDCRCHEHSTRAQWLPAALPAQACRSRRSAIQALDLSLRRQQPLVSLAGWRPCHTLSACTALRPAADFASAPNRYEAWETFHIFTTDTSQGLQDGGCMLPTLRSLATAPDYIRSNAANMVCWALCMHISSTAGHTHELSRAGGAPDGAVARA